MVLSLMGKNILDIVKNYDFLREKSIVDFRLFKKQGICNTTYLLSTLDKQYIIKQPKEALHVEKKLEYKIQLKTYKKGISSQPIIMDIKNHIFISIYLEGFHKIFIKKTDLKKLADTLLLLHSIKLKGKVFDIEKFFIKNHKSVDIKLKSTILRLKKYRKDLVLCHNDLNPENILFSSTVKFIDWEFASINDRYFDLASIILEFNLNQRFESYFLQRYFKNNKYNKEKLKTYKILYKYLCKIWYDKQERRKKCHEQF